MAFTGDTDLLEILTFGSDHCDGVFVILPDPSQIPVRSQLVANMAPILLESVSLAGAD